MFTPIKVYDNQTDCLTCMNLIITISKTAANDYHIDIFYLKRQYIKVPFHVFLLRICVGEQYHHTCMGNVQVCIVYIFM